MLPSLLRSVAATCDAALLGASPTARHGTGSCCFKILASTTEFVDQLLAIPK